MSFYEKDAEKIEFETLSGKLIVEKRGDLLEMDFPAYDLKPVEITDQMVEAIGKRPKEAYMGRDLLCVFSDEADIRSMTPNLEKVKELDGLLLQVTAPGTDYDCVSRSFAPKLDVPEDPVCGSGHCHIVPYWADRLKQSSIKAFQASPRSGELFCRLEGNRVKLAGKAALFSESELNL